MTADEYRALRNKACITQGQMADLLHVSIATIIRRESGRTQITYEMETGILSICGNEDLLVKTRHASYRPNKKDDYRTARERAGLTHEQLAEKIGVSAAVVVRRESGLASITREAEIALWYACGDLVDSYESEQLKDEINTLQYRLSQYEDVKSEPAMSAVKNNGAAVANQPSQEQAAKTPEEIETIEANRKWVADFLS